MKISIGADHRGFEIKTKLQAKLKATKHSVIDAGTFSAESCDYPEYALKVAKQVARQEVERGILICKSGIGMAIAANKVKGVRAGVCYSLNQAKLSRQHNDANVLVIGVDDLQDPLEQIVETWLATKFEGGRHQRRLDLISKIESEEKGSI